MCLSIPMQIQSIEGLRARCEAKGVIRDVSLFSLWDDPAIVGEYVRVSQGNALAGDPMMQMLTPLADTLAAKMNIPPQMAVMVVSLVAHQLLASHPASGQQSLLNVNQLQQQISSGQGVSHDYLHSSGLVSKLVEQTGLDKGTAAQSLKTVFDMLGQH